MVGRGGRVYGRDGKGGKGGKGGKDIKFYRFKILNKLFNSSLP
jgi:hypothetical protein